MNRLGALVVVALGTLGAPLPGRVEPAPVHVRVNQIGFEPSAGKHATAFSTAALPDRFEVVTEPGERVVFTARSRSLVTAAWGRFDRFADLDFTRLTTAGRYRVRFGGVTSAPFDVRSGVYDTLPNALLEFLRQQRCGFNPFLKRACHQLDGRTAYGPMPDGTPIDARGGWHDAADLLKYLITSSNTVAVLLAAYESRPEIFGDRVIAPGLPGSNRVPDVLDEARWGLEWMLRLHPAPDQLFHQVADDRDHAGFRLPPDDSVDYGWGPGGARVVYFATGRPQGLGQYQSRATGIANLAGRYAAAMALAARIWSKGGWDPAFAARCRRAAIEVYALGRQHEGYQQGNSYGAPYRYNEDTWADDMEWGAAELYRLTGEGHYLAEALTYSRQAGTTSWIGRDEVEHYRYYPFVNLGHWATAAQASRGDRRRVLGYYETGLRTARRVADGNAWRVGVPFVWCSNNLVTALATQAILWERSTTHDDFRALVADHVDWLLGRNPWGTSMLTGIPADGVAPRDPQLITSHVTGRLVRGGLVDGPVREAIFRSLKGVTLSRPDAFAPFQSEGAVYHDDWQDYSTNEPTLDGTASAVLLFALLGSRQ